MTVIFVYIYKTVIQKTWTHNPFSVLTFAVFRKMLELLAYKVSSSEVRAFPTTQIAALQRASSQIAALIRRCLPVIQHDIRGWFNIRDIYHIYHIRGIYHTYHVRGKYHICTVYHNRGIFIYIISWVNIIYIMSGVNIIYIISADVSCHVNLS